MLIGIEPIGKIVHRAMVALFNPASQMAKGIRVAGGGDTKEWKA
jgi:hypothetical protein